MTKLALISSDFDMSYLAPVFKEKAPDLDVVMHGSPDSLLADIAVCWNLSVGVLRSYKNLRLVHGIAAGVDNILLDPALPDVPICRVVDPQQARAMSEYVAWATLHFLRHFDRAFANKTEHAWTRYAQIPASNFSVGVMGLGEIGRVVAKDLTGLGFAVRGWARSQRLLEGIETFAGAEQLSPFLGSLDVLVCMLPLTAETYGILSSNTFEKMKDGSVLVHVGRGGHLIVSDLQHALESGRLRGAIVDVLPQEPLPPSDPLWDVPNLLITPHMASLANSETIVEQIVTNIRRQSAGESLLNVVDFARGY